jgi:hypothetical protein
MSDDLFDNELFESLPQAADLRLYIEEGRPTNHFLTALLANDLMATLGRADAPNKAAIEDYCLWLKSHAPAACHGSRETVEAWIARGGIKGR